MNTQTEAVERLAKLRARVDAATAGPWDVSGYDSGHSRFATVNTVITKRLGDPIADMRDLDRMNLADEPNENGNNDAWFIANARQDVPNLLNFIDTVIGLMNGARTRADYGVRTDQGGGETYGPAVLVNDLLQALIDTAEQIEP